MAEVVGGAAPPFSRSVMAAVVTLWELTATDEGERGTCHSTCTVGTVKSGGGDATTRRGEWSGGEVGCRLIRGGDRGKEGRGAGHRGERPR